MPPQIARFENSFGSDDAGDEFRRRHVEGGVAGGAGGVGDSDLVEFAPKSSISPKFSITVSS